MAAWKGVMEGHDDTYSMSPHTNVVMQVRRGLSSEQ